jgi:hypothetical protein
MDINDYRHEVRYQGEARDHISDFMPKHEWAVVDSWTGDVISEHKADGKETAALVAETRCAEMNAPAVALEFASRLALHLERARNEEEANPGDLCEDLDKILEWHLAALRGRTREFLDQDRLHVKTVGLG